MSGHPIAHRLAALRKAGAELRRRAAGESLAALATVFDGWGQAESPWRRSLAAELPAATGFSEPVVAEGLRLGLADWSGERFLELVAREIGPAERLHAAGPEMVAGFDVTAVFLAGAIPMPTLLALIAPLALRSPLLAKVGSRDRVTAHHVARSIAGCDSLLGRCIECSEFPSDDGDSVDALLTADCVVASGSDATVAAIGARLRPPRRLVTYGHRLSVAVLGGAALRGERLRDSAERLALDVALWDQLGCLSPVAAYVVEAGAAADAFAEALAQALADVEERLPRGAIDTAAAARIAHERADAEMRAAAGARVAVHAGPGTRWTVVREDAASVRPAPLHRFVRVLPVSDNAALIDALGPLAPHLAAVALAGFGSGDAPPLVRRLVDLGASRICAPGEMQCPPLAWRHDNRGVLTPLARFADWEAPRRAASGLRRDGQKSRPDAADSV